MYREGDCLRVVFSFIYIYLYLFCFLFGVWILLRGGRRVELGFCIISFVHKSLISQDLLPGLHGIEAGYICEWSSNSNIRTLISPHNHKLALDRMSEWIHRDTWTGLSC